MRRSDREIKDKTMIEKLIAGEQVLRIAFYDEGDIYIVPVNYGYLYANDKYTFYFHGAKGGRKYELSRSEPLVGFEIDGKYKVLESESACNFSVSFQSIIGTGALHLIEKNEEKRNAQNAIMKQMANREEWNYSIEMLNAVAVFQLDVEKISCKAK